MQRKLIGCLMLVVLTQASGALAQTSAPLPEDNPAVWAARAARATSLREESTRLRNAADAQRAQEDLACRKKFWENMCKDGARERWIEKINVVRAMEIEAVGLERNQRAHEVAMRAKERAANPPKPPLILPDASAPNAQSGAQLGVTSGKAKSAKPADTPEPAKPLGKPINARKQAEQQSQKAQARAEEVKKASDRAAQAREDRARYAQRAREHAQKEAERKAKASGQSQPAAQPK